MRVLAYIPARGGSKRIPNKNIRDFCGKPLIAYAIEQGKAHRRVDRVIVDTDDEAIAAVAKKNGFIIANRVQGTGYCPGYCDAINRNAADVEN